MKPQRLDVSTDYRLALLWLIDRLESARVSEVTAAFEGEFGDLITSEHRESTDERGYIKWEHYVAWARFHLVQVGLMGSGGRGVWTITPAGHTWLRENPNADHADLASFLKQSGTSAVPSRRRRRAARKQPSAGSPDGQAHALLDQHLTQIRSFLQGRLSRPSDDVLCDWVQFCYTFGLFDEGYELFTLIVPSAVNEWLYGRTRKLAQVCCIRARNKA
jgi:hypothetical protein